MRISAGEETKDGYVRYINRYDEYVLDTKMVVLKTRPGLIEKEKWGCRLE